MQHEGKKTHAVTSVICFMVYVKLMIFLFFSVFDCISDQRKIWKRMQGMFVVFGRRDVKTGTHLGIIYFNVKKTIGLSG